MNKYLTTTNITLKDRTVPIADTLTFNGGSTARDQIRSRHDVDVRANDGDNEYIVTYIPFDDILMATFTHDVEAVDDPTDDFCGSGESGDTALYEGEMHTNVKYIRWYYDPSVGGLQDIEYPLLRVTFDGTVYEVEKSVIEGFSIESLNGKAIYGDINLSKTPFFIFPEKGFFMVGENGSRPVVKIEVPA